MVRCHSFYPKIPANLDEIVSTHDRCGDCKAAGNYAADLESMHAAKRHGDRIGLYLDVLQFTGLKPGSEPVTGWAIPSVCIWMHENVDMWRSLTPQILWPSPRTR